MPDDLQAGGPTLHPDVLAGLQNGWLATSDLVAPQSTPPAMTPLDGPSLHPAISNAAQTGFAPAGPVTSPAEAAIPPDDARLSPAQFTGGLAAQDKQRAYLATLPGQQETAMRGEVAGREREAQLATQKGDVDAQAADEAAAIRAHGIADQQKLAAKQQADFEAQMAQRQKLFADTQKAVEAAAKKTIDPNRMWNSKSTGEKIMAGIGVLLAGVGQGLSGDHGPNPAMKLITDSIDRDVDAQKANIEQGNKTVGMRRDLATDYGHLSDKQDEHYDFLRAQGRVMAADQLEASAAHYAAPMKQLAAQQDAAKLRADAAQIMGGFADKKVAQQHADALLAEERRRTNISGGELALSQLKEKHAEDWRDKDAKEKAREYDETLKEKYATAKAAGKTADAKQIEDLRKYGLNDPATGAPILTQDGEKIMAHADQLEKAARSAPDNQTRDALTVQAKGMRQAAETQYVLQSENAKEVKPKLIAAQNLADGIDGILEEFDKDPSGFDRAKFQQLESMIEQAKTHDVQFLGAKVSSREMGAIQPAFGPDVSNFASREFSRDKIRAALVAMRDGTLSDADALLKGEGHRGSFRIAAHRGDRLDTIGDQTSVEAGEAAQPGAVTRATGIDFSHPLTGPGARDPQSIEESAGGGPTGLSARDTAKVSSLVGRYNNATDAEQAKILTQLTAYATSDRESIANGAIGLLRDNPDVYKHVLDALPPDKQAELRTFDSAKLDNPIKLYPKAPR